jgi:hypothetical protein
LNILNCIIAFILTVSVSDDGWVVLEKKGKELSQNEDDPSVWPLFFKKIGSERIRIRFPKEPAYRYTESGDLEIWVKRGEESYLLLVQKIGNFSSDERVWDWEHVVQTDSHFYHFKILSQSLESSQHDFFFRSFFIEKIV